MRTIAIILITLSLGSCASTYSTCPAYSQETTQEVYYASLDCENCDEVD